MSGFDLNAFIDQLEIIEAAQDMHYSFFYNPEAEYYIYNEEL